MEISKFKQLRHIVKKLEERRAIKDIDMRDDVTHGDESRGNDVTDTHPPHNKKWKQDKTILGTKRFNDKLFAEKKLEGTSP